MTENRRNYYTVLGISSTATQEDIKKVFRTKIKATHPDFRPASEFERANAESKELIEAYDTLSDSRKRSEYDHLIGIETQSASIYSYTQTREQSEIDLEDWILLMILNVRSIKELNANELNKLLIMLLNKQRIKKLNVEELSKLREILIIMSLLAKGENVYNIFK